MTKEEFRGFVKNMGLAYCPKERAEWAADIGKHDRVLGDKLMRSVEAESDIYAYCRARMEGK